ncbi:ABC transporter permease, partial [Kingella kingae]|uniref:ABC transporter permease n=1 Tax=Kingella kingae TaxID=504 RepID=UPI002557519F
KRQNNTAEKLFPAGTNPLGKTILFRKRPLTVIGVLQKEDNMMGGSDSLNLYSPYTTVMSQISGDKFISSLAVKVKDNVDSQVAEKGITELLLARHGTEDFFMLNSDSIKQTIESTTGTMTMLISCIALISLVVGGIGAVSYTHL